MSQIMEALFKASRVALEGPLSGVRRHASSCSRLTRRGAVVGMGWNWYGQEREPPMFYPSPSIEQLSSVISQVTGPAFLLAAEAQLLSVLVSRLDRIVDRSRDLAALDDEDAQAHRKMELPILRRRAMLMHRSIYWGVGSCVITSVLVILSFAAAFFRLRHEYGAGLMFGAAMALFTAALIAFAREVQLGYAEIEANITPPRTPAGKSSPHA
jgi:hypothetical protein